VCLFLCAQARSQLVEEGVSYAIESPALLKQTAALFRQTRTRLSFHYGDVHDSGLQVVVAPNDSAFRALLGPHFPDWGVGAADTRALRIILRSPGTGGWPHDYDQVAVHEYAHIFLHLRAGPRARVPRWLDEGFAMQAAFEWNMESHLRLVRAAWSGHLLNLDLLEEVNQFQGEKAALAYTESFAAYQFLEEQYGREGVGELLSALGEGLSLEQAFLRTTGTAYPEFQAALVHRLKEQSNVLNLLTDPGMLWGALALFIIVGWWIKKRRAKDIERRWRTEDRIQGEPDFNEYVDPDDDESWRSR
jgi:hypothetical protein